MYGKIKKTHHQQRVQSDTRVSLPYRSNNIPAKGHPKELKMTKSTTIR